MRNSSVSPRTTVTKKLGSHYTYLFRYIPIGEIKKKLRYIIDNDRKL